MANRNVLILKNGSTSPSVSVRLGDYDRWFVQMLGRQGYDFHIVHAHLGQPLPRQVRGFDAIIATGSPSSVTEKAPWMRAAGEFLVNAAARSVPVLGVCFGHQLLAWMHGAQVQQNPRGREIGTVTCELSARGRADPLFDDVPVRFEVQATHGDDVVRPPPELELLASNAHTPVQAFRIGKFIRAVQFHPEIDPAAMKAMVDARAPRLQEEASARREDGQTRLRAVYAGVRPGGAGRKILQNFLHHFT